MTDSMRRTASGARLHTKQCLRLLIHSATELCRAWGSRPGNRSVCGPDRATLAFGAEHDGAMHVVIDLRRRIASRVRPGQQPTDLSAFNSSRVREIFVTLAIGRCSLAPAETLATVPVTGADRRSGMMTPSSARGVSRTQDGAQIVRVFDTIEHNDKRMLGSARGHQIIEITILFCRCGRYQALMGCVAGKFVEFHAR